MRFACTLFALVLLPGAVFAHSLKQDQRVPAVGVEDKGELLYQQEQRAARRQGARDPAHRRALLREREERRRDRGD